MKNFIATTFIFLVIVRCSSCINGNEGHCVIPEVDDSKWNTIYEQTTTDVAGLHQELKFSGALEVHNVTSDTRPDYIEVLVDRNLLHIQSTKSFENIDYDLIDLDPAAAYTIKVSIYLRCRDGLSRLVYILHVQDTNNHAPEFLAPKYELLLPSPLLPAYALTSIGGEIVVRDVDFSNDNILFALEPPENFEVRSGPVPGKKKHFRLALSVTTPTKFSADKKYILTATDSGSTPRSATADLTIRLDGARSLPEPPRFSKPSYSFAYGADGSLRADDQIFVATDKKAALNVSSNNPNFVAEYDRQTSEVTVFVIQPLDAPDERTVVFYLTANDEVSQERCTILVAMPDKVVVGAPRFAQPFYRAAYGVDANGTADVRLAEVISVTENADKTSVQIEKDYDKYFTLTRTTNNSWTLSSSGVNLPDAVVKRGKELTLELEAAVEGAADVDRGYGALIVAMPDAKAAPAFTDTHYSAEYVVEGGAATVRLATPIQVSRGAADATLRVSLAGDFSDHFELRYVDPALQIAVTKPLDGSVLEQGGELFLEVRAEVAGAADRGTALVVLKLPERSPPQAPQFDRAFYRFRYSVGGGGDSVSGEQDIGVAGGPGLQVHIVGAFQENFRVVPAPNGYTLAVRRNLNATTLREHRELLLTLEAAAEGAAERGRAAALVRLPGPPAPPRFTQPHYGGDYVIGDDGRDYIKMNGSDITASGDDTRISLNGSYMVLFDLTRVGNVWKISLNENIKPSVFANTKHLIFTVEAVSESASKAAEATLIITLPEIVSKFSQNYYKAVYEMKNNGEPTVTLRKLISAVDKNTKITISGPYAEYFNVKNMDKHQWNLEVSKPLTDTILNNEKELLLTLEANVDGAKFADLATLIVELPETSVNVVPQFSKLYYFGKYDVQKALMDQFTCEEISIEGENARISIAGNYSNNFKTSLKDGKLDIALVKSFDNETVNNVNEIVLTLEASIDGNDETGTALLIIEIENTIDVKSPQFGQFLYSVRYYVEGGKARVVAKGPKIQIVGDEVGKTAIRIKDDVYGQYFRVTFSPTEGLYEVGVARPLDDEIVAKANKSEILTVLQANTTGANSGAFALLRIELPEKPSQVIPTFSSPFYRAVYSLAGQVDLQAQITVVSDEAEATLVEVKGEYATNFAAVKEGSTWKIQVSRRLDEEVLLKHEDITLVLQAYLTNSNFRGTSTVALRLPETRPEFTKSHYAAEYKPDGPSIEIKGDPIAVLSNYLDRIQMDVAGPFKGNFEVALDSEQKWKVNVHKALDQDVLVKGGQIAVEVMAYLGDSSDEAALLIQLPAPPRLCFNQTYYTAQYVVDGAVQLPNLIRVNDNAAEISVAAEYFANFRVACNGDAKSGCTIAVTKKLSDAVLSSQTEIAVALKATKRDGSDEASATVIIDLPMKGAVGAPLFSDTYYTAYYQEQENGNGDVYMNKTIQVQGPDDAAVRVAGDAGGYFQVERKGARDWRLTVRQKIPDAVVATRTPIILILVAEVGGESAKGHATLVVELPASHSGDASAEDCPSQAPFVAVIVTLAVSLVGLLAAAVLLYVLKFRTPGSYSQMGAPEKAGTRFSKNPALRDTPATEHPKRRPTTGLVKYEPYGEPAAEEEPRERRKSVTFDDHVARVPIGPNDEERTEL